MFVAPAAAAQKAIRRVRYEVERFGLVTNGAD
jgi:hypothetical protein